MKYLTHPIINIDKFSQNEKLTRIKIKRYFAYREIRKKRKKKDLFLK